MRLFEVDQGSARDVLAVLQGLANKKGESAEIPFAVLHRMLEPFDLGVNTPDALIALKNQVDPQGDVIDSILPDGTLVLRTTEKSPLEPEPVPRPASTPRVDAMASSAAKKLSPDL